MPIGAAWDALLVTPLVNLLIALSAIAFGSFGIAILLLTAIIRLVTFPLTLRTLKSMRAMQELQPKIQEVNRKYSDPRRRSEETMKLYREHKVNPLGCLGPMVIQMPIFFGLFSVLNNSFAGLTGVGLLNEELSAEFGRATLFGIAPLGATMLTSDGNVWVIIIAAILVVLMTASQFITQLQIMSKNQSAEMKASPMYRQQRILLYVLPLVFLFSGVAFPLGVMFYWFVSNIWTMVQQFIVIRNMPTPGSEAALAREARLAKKRQKKGLVDDEIEGTVIEEPKKTQRQQPVSKNRAKKKGGR